MANPIFERPYTAEVAELIAGVDGHRLCSAIKSRVGSVKLDDGREAQIHLCLTTDKQDFLKKPTATKRQRLKKESRNPHKE